MNSSERTSSQTEDLDDYALSARLPAPPSLARRGEQYRAPLARPSAQSVDSYERRRLSSQQSQRTPPATKTGLVVRPVPVSCSSVKATGHIPSDSVVRTAVLKLDYPTHGPFPLASGNQPPPLANAFFPSDEEGSEGEWNREAGNRRTKGLSWWQWLLANLLILFVGIVFVMVVFGSRVLSTSGRHRLDRTTLRIVLLPDASFRNPPPFGLPGPSNRDGAHKAHRGRNLPAGHEGNASRLRTTSDSREATTSH